MLVVMCNTIFINILLVGIQRKMNIYFEKTEINLLNRLNPGLKIKNAKNVTPKLNCTVRIKLI